MQPLPLQFTVIGVDEVEMSAEGIVKVTISNGRRPSALLMNRDHYLMSRREIAKGLGVALTTIDLVGMTLRLDDGLLVVPKETTADGVPLESGKPCRP